MKWLTLALIWTLLLGFGLPWLPALGPVFDVRSGIWDHRPKPFENATLKDLKKPVTITFDKNDVPHLFAESESDLFRAQGYLTAAYRQFQMDLSTRAADGRLSELIGERGKELDRYFVSLGMRKSNRERLEKYNQDPQAKAMMENFVHGANSWIESSDYVPPEYKIFGVKPPLYSTDRIINMSKILAYNLSGRSNDIHLSEIQQQIGYENTLALFPEHNKVEDYVWTKKFNGRPPGHPEVFKYETKLKNIPKYFLPNPGQGSNNWVVAPSKSESGTSLLANDTHLGLQLPSIWMEIQLSCPEFNVYGVSLVGVPGIINGFNKDLAWGPTNGVTDIHDFYEVEFTNRESNHYTLDGSEQVPVVEKETIKSKWFDETVEVTHLKNGALVYRDGVHGLVSDFAGHRSNNELMAVRGLLNSKTVEECIKTFDRWSGPTQNFVCADRKNIGWVHAGYIPQREDGSGRFIMDGTKSQQGMSVPLPEELRPTAINPPEGYILSANQKTVPREFPYYMGWDFEPPFRGIAIRRGLEAKAKLNAQDMIALQNNPYDVEAEILAPLLLKALDREKLSTQQKEWAEKLDKWNHLVHSKDVEPAIYKEWIVQLRKVLFDDDYRLAGERVLYPRDLRISVLLENLLNDSKHPDAQFVDNRKTPEVETLAMAVTTAFLDAWKKLDESSGGIENATWKKWNSVAFRHLARLPGFGSEILEMDGSVESIRGINTMHGPVYKIVVETGEWPKAWLSVPGGLSGDPFDKNFEAGVREWAAGEMRKAEYYKNLEEAKAAAKRVVVLSPEGAQ